MTTLIGNEASDNGSNGFDLVSSSQTRFEGTSAWGTATTGSWSSMGRTGTSSIERGEGEPRQRIRTSSARDDDTFSMNRSEGNLWRGYFFVETSGLLLSGNWATGNTLAAYEEYQSSGATFRGNSAIRSGAGFFLADASNGNIVEKNLATGNQSVGFVLDGASQNLLTGNEASGNAGDGFLLHLRCFAEHASREPELGGNGTDGSKQFELEPDSGECCQAEPHHRVLPCEFVR